MIHTFTREQIKRIIIEELERNEKAEVEEEVDNLIDSYLSLKEEKKGGFFADLLKIIKGQPEDKQEEMAELALMKAQTRRGALKKIGIVLVGASFIGGGVSYLNHLEDLASAPRVELQAKIKDAQDEFNREGDYESGVEFADQSDFYLENYEFSVEDIQSITEFPADSNEELIASLRTIPTPHFISYQSLADKPIPKFKVDRGEDYINKLTRLFEDMPQKRRVSVLVKIYKQLSMIGQVGLAGPDAAAIKVKVSGYDIVTVQPPEWTILFTFLTKAMQELDEAEREEFDARVLSSEESRYFSTDRGKHKAVRYGYEAGKKGAKLNKDSSDYKNAPTLVQRGYAAALAGKSFPGLPSRVTKEKP